MTYDLLVIGGGINGAGIARDAAGRGLSVILVEKADLAGATSSASSKLIHGGLRYLEQLEFRLVAEALAEREILLRIAGHLTWPTRFVDSFAMNPLLEATALATEDAIVNSLVASGTMRGANGNTVPALPHGSLQAVLEAHGRRVAAPAGAAGQCAMR